MESKRGARKSGLGCAAEAAPMLTIPRLGLGKSYPKQNPGSQSAVDAQGTALDDAIPIRKAKG